MSNLKKALFILIPLAIVVVLFIAFTALKLAKKDTETIAYTDSTIQGHSVSRQEFNVFNTNQYDDLKLGQKESPLGNCQDSQNIKQGDYVPRITQDAETNEPQDIQNIINSATKTTTTEATEQYTQETPEDSGIWGWVPQTILRDPIKSTAASESPEVLAIRKYGNEVGTLVKAFTRNAGNQPDKLSALMADYTDNQSSLAVLGLGLEYTELSKDLELLWNPPELGSTPDKLSQSYHFIGVELLALSKVENDTDALTQIYSYNASVDTFAKEFIKLVNLFGAYGIIFTKGEGGDIFTPPSSGPSL